MALKIKPGKDGRVNPELMDLLVRLAQHRDLCSQCLAAMNQATGTYCTTGAEFIKEIAKHPDAEFTPD